ncbi:hypothetical protein Olsu_1184 [Olsenella uli DSM 7084]|uniref:Uncharacterized protein n=1 Tax=Olsenella uli (strain ATCC 49627 / DSM 7084 / CCUG 31166 / CIP 109912 / JCM 12494 / LMG 11480 / NCIMB 702895 / VPI D76D-27C) TaxID=633147 RepID=E1QVZ0_OLSUV|nr:hypothetical protein Olsu_1184 [Olsenella uli DSM 7084]
MRGSRIRTATKWSYLRLSIWLSHVFPCAVTWRMRTSSISTVHSLW